MSKPACSIILAAILALPATMVAAQVSLPDARHNALDFAPADPLRNTLTAVESDWLMFNHDQQRTGWNNGETVLTKKNVSRLKLLWSTKLSTPMVITTLQTLTAPVVVSGVATANGTKTLVFVMGADDTLFAVDADEGKIIWQKTFKNTLTPVRGAVWSCANTEQATPAIDKQKGLIYFTTSDGNLRGLSLTDGTQKLAPTQFVAPFSRNWSLNLVNDVVYTTAGRGCGGDAAHPVEAGNVAAADVSDPTHVMVSRIFTGTGRRAGPWSRAGVALGPQGVYVQTADGLSDPAAGFLGSSVLAVRIDARGIADSFTPPNWRYLNTKDLDLASGSPTIFPFKGRALIATGGKEGVIYLLDANALGGGLPEHGKALYTTPRFGNDPAQLDGHGIWGGMSSYENARGERYVYVPMWNLLSKDSPTFRYHNGDTSQGSIMALQVVQNDAGLSLTPIWVTGINQAPDVPVVANGIVYAVGTGEQTITNPGGRQLDQHTDAAELYRSTPVGHQVLYALDAETGAVLYSSKNILKDWDHFVEPVVSHGKVFVVSHDAHLYAFGLK